MVGFDDSNKLLLVWVEYQNLSSFKSFPLFQNGPLSYNLEAFWSCWDLRLFLKSLIV